MPDYENPYSPHNVLPSYFRYPRRWSYLFGVPPIFFESRIFGTPNARFWPLFPYADAVTPRADKIPARAFLLRECR